MLIKRPFILLALIAIASAGFSQVPRKVLVEHFTNTKCSVCKSRNPGFYSNLNAQPNTLHLAIHPSSPYNGCLLYQQNATANDARTHYYGVYGGTPRLVINGNVISASANYSSTDLFTPYQSLTAPASIRIEQQKFGTDSVRSTVIIKTEATHALGALSLFVALAEDTVFYTGSNGEPKHFDVFRKALSHTAGNPLTLPATVGDSVVFTFSSASDAIWNFSRIYTLAVLQETGSKNLVQAEACSPAGGYRTGSNETNASLKIRVFPNPVKEILHVQLQEISTATAGIYTLDGKLIIENTFSGNELKMDVSGLPPGMYMLRLVSDRGVCTQKIVRA